jgi:P4 family phage/plasmid primase-like protien
MMRYTPRLVNLWNKDNRDAKEKQEEFHKLLMEDCPLGQRHMRALYLANCFVFSTNGDEAEVTYEMEKWNERLSIQLGKAELHSVISDAMNYYEKKLEAGEIRRPVKYEFDAIKIMEKVGEKTTWYVTVGDDKKKVMYYWDIEGKVWRPGGLVLIQQFVKEYYPYVNSTQFNEVVFEIQSRTLLLESKFVPNPDLIQFKDKVLDMQTLEIDEPKVLDYITERIDDVELLEKAPMPREFIKAMQKCFPEPENLFHCLQAFSSVLLLRTQRIEKIFFMTGSGGNGKSTILKAALDNVFGDMVSHISPHDIGEDKFSEGLMVGKIANIHPDISEKELTDLSRLKTLASGDRVSAERKYKDRVNADLKLIQIYGTNRMPEITEKSKGVFRRLSVIDMVEVIKDVDPEIDSKLADLDERNRILHMLIRVARFTRRHGFIYEKTQKEIQEIIEEKASPLRQFLSQDHVMIDTDNKNWRIEKKFLYSKWNDYRKANNYSMMTFRKFNSTIFNEKAFDTKESAGRTYWVGITFKDAQESLDK